MKKVCVFSGSTDNLNTSMKVRLDDGSMVEAWVSDEFAENATPKSVREAYIKRQETIEKEKADLLARCKALGLTIVEEDQMPAPPAAAPIRVAQSVQIPDQEVPSFQQPVIEEGKKVISGRAADARSINPAIKLASPDAGRLVGGALPEYQITSQSKPTKDLKEGEVAEIGVILGRGGEVAIPVRRSGPAGTTTIHVVDNGGDSRLQRRFKDMARESQSTESGSICYGRDGYDIQFRICPLCHGTGIAINKKTCPKCKGTGEIEVSRF